MYEHILKGNSVPVMSNTYDVVNQLWILLEKIEAELNGGIIICLIDKIALTKGSTEMTQWRKLSLEAALCDQCGAIWGDM